MKHIKQTENTQNIYAPISTISDAEVFGSPPPPPEPWPLLLKREECCSVAPLASGKQSVCSQLEKATLENIQNEQQQHHTEKATREMACFCKFMGI